MRNEEREFAEAIANLNYCNPFLPERILYERKALGSAFHEAGAEWNRASAFHAKHPNLLRILRKTEAIIVRLREGWPKNGRVDRKEATLYENLVLCFLFHRYSERFDDTIVHAWEPGKGRRGVRVPYYEEFRRDYDKFLDIPGFIGDDPLPAPHLFAALFQFRRAFYHIYRHLIGRSDAMSRLRAATWQSIFTCDIRRYRRVLYRRMEDFTTLVTGPSGTGKELVARAIGLSRYVPFEEKPGCFAEDFSGSFLPLNLSALSPTLIESELFGHRKGSFTGALQDRTGWLELCSPGGAVFLDEIGDLDCSIQVKLLRILQEREFQRIGETETCIFRGKIMAATNRDLAAEMKAGRFREDFYYRLCSDLICTPSLREQIDNSREQLEPLVEFIVCRLLGTEEAGVFTQEACAWIERHLGLDYPWDGNFRELEQCVRNIMLRKEYIPSRSQERKGGDWMEQVKAGKYTAEELLSHYCSLVYSQTGNIEETARRLNLDRRTVKRRLKR